MKVLVVMGQVVTVLRWRTDVSGLAVFISAHVSSPFGFRRLQCLTVLLHSAYMTRASPKRGETFAGPTVTWWSSGFKQRLGGELVRADCLGQCRSATSSAQAPTIGR